MKIISLNAIIKKRKKYKLILLVGIFILVVAGSYLLVKNPRWTRASSYVGGVLTIDSTNCTGTVSLYGAGVPNGGLVASDGSPQRVVVSGTCTGITSNTTILPTDRIVITNKEVKMLTDPGVPFKIAQVTINDGGKLTHDALTSTNGDFDSSFTLSIRGGRKKVDLEISGNLILNGTGKIDVNGKGFSTAPTEFDGAGPGGSPGYTGGTEKVCTGGAGYGGWGGQAWHGDWNFSWGGMPYPTSSDLAVLWPGSGSGKADGSSADANGVAGGGVIQLKIGGQLTVSASGLISSNGSNGAANGGSASGGGSGGSIKIIFDTLQIHPPTFDVSAGLGSGDSDLDGEVGSIYYNDMPLTGGDRGFIQAIGGNGTFSYAGGGGGGRIAFYGAGESYASQRVVKTLTAVERAGAGDNGDADSDLNDNFNPYALQDDDVIKVTLQVIGINTTPYYIEDQILKTPNGTHKCTPDPSKPFSKAPESSWISDPIWWKIDTPADVYYHCKVS